MQGLPSILSLFLNKFNKFNNTVAQMLDSIYHVTFKLLTTRLRSNNVFSFQCIFSKNVGHSNLKFCRLIGDMM